MSLAVLNVSQLAEITKKDRRTVTKELAGLAAVPGPKNSKQYNAIDSLKILLSGGSDSEIEKSLLEESLRIERAKREKIEMEVAKLRGELIPIETVVKDLEMACSYVRAQLFSLPNKLSMPLAIISDPALVNSKLHNALSECLTELNTDYVYIEQLETLERNKAEKFSDIQSNAPDAT